MKNQIFAIKETILPAVIKMLEHDIEAVGMRKPQKTSLDYNVVSGVAHIPIYGVISKNNDMGFCFNDSNILTSDIESCFKRAHADPAVKSILLDIDSPGGTTGGVAELSDMIYSARGRKPIVAFANGQMDSAAYWIGSAADKVYASKGAEFGSIGVYSVVSDYSVANHNAGLKREIIKAGKYKAAGHPDKHMTEDDEAAIQDEVNAYYSLFVDAVKRNRNMSNETVSKVATGKVFIGNKGIDTGLIDGIRNLSEFLPSTQACNDNNNRQSRAEETDFFKNLTLEQIKVRYPDIIKAIHNEADRAEIAEAVKAERKRCLLMIETAKGFGGIRNPKLLKLLDEDYRPGKEADYQLAFGETLMWMTEWDNSLDLQKNYRTKDYYVEFRKALKTAGKKFELSEYATK